MTASRTSPLQLPRARPAETVDLDEAEDFIRLHHAEDREDGPPDRRLFEVRRAIAETGTYRHTPAELAFGARVAWRNSDRCIGRLYWRSLRLRDRREVDTADGVFAECVAHLVAGGNRGAIRPTITVFAPRDPGREGIRIWNEQLVRYAGYRRPDGSVLGDPRNADFTSVVRSLGWPGGAGTAFDPLPVVVRMPGGRPRLYDLPRYAVLEVPIQHPDHDWFVALGLRWHAVPAIADMDLRVGGITYPAAPFNGWYMGTEIGARNLADESRYDMLPRIATRLGLDTSSERTLWRDRALVELNVAVLASFERAGVTMTDHHTETRRFMLHLDRERRAGRPVPADWSWIVPPMSGSTTPVFHRYYDPVAPGPRYARRPPLVPPG
jgi:nitric-oxide synthase